jgi:Tol biopolymer transport system component
VRRTLSAVGGAALAIAALGLALLAPPEHAGARPGAADQAGSLVAFQSDRDGDSEIWVVSENGGQLRQLTKNRYADASPTWTPDGERIVFASTRHGNWELYSMTARGTDVVRLTRTHADEFDPVVSRDGERVAFESNAARNWDIFVMGIQGGNQTNLTSTRANDFDPVWSPDFDSESARIAFSTGTRRDYDVAVVPADAPQRISTVIGGPSSDFDPNWSGDDEIVFTRRAGGTRDLFVRDSNGDVRDVATGPTDDWGAVWADNGRILFNRETDPLRRATPYRIFVMDRDGGGQRQLVRGVHGVDVEPAPQPGSSPRARLVSPAPRLLALATTHCVVKYGTNTVNDPLNGTVNRDCIYARGGNDRVWAKGAGDPDVRGGPGADTVNGDAGDDRFYMVDGEPDVVRGGDGAGDEAWVDEDGLDTVVSAVAH